MLRLVYHRNNILGAILDGYSFTKTKSCFRFRPLCKFTCNIHHFKVNFRSNRTDFEEFIWFSMSVSRPLNGSMFNDHGSHSFVLQLHLLIPLLVACRSSMWLFAFIRVDSDLKSGFTLKCMATIWSKHKHTHTNFRRYKIIINADLLFSEHNFFLSIAWSLELWHFQYAFKVLMVSIVAPFKHRERCNFLHFTLINSHTMMFLLFCFAYLFNDLVFYCEYDATLLSYNSCFAAKWTQSTILFTWDRYCLCLWCFFFVSYCIVAGSSFQSDSV